MSVKFTELLLEGEREDKAKDLARILNSGDWYNETPLLYRGTSHGTDTWVVKNRREFRQPIDTDNDIHMLVDVTGSAFYPDLPSRNSSRFASTDPRVAEKYGEVYMVFPHKDAEVGGIFADSLLEFFQPVDLALARVREELDSVKNSMDDETMEGRYGGYVDDWVIDLLNVLYRIRAKNKSGFSKVGDILYNFENMKDFYTELDNISRELLGNSRLKTAVKSFQQFATSIQQASDLFYQLSLYFNDLKGGFDENDDEVLVEGRLIQADMNFMKEYFLLPSEGSVSRVKFKNE